MDNSSLRDDDKCIHGDLKYLFVKRFDTLFWMWFDLKSVMLIIVMK